MKIRKATIHEDSYLTDLAFRSKAYWGYSEDFMEACRNDLTVSSEYIATSLVFVLEDEDTITGFIGLEQEEDGWLLKDLFIDPKYIGKGYGKTLWKNMIEVTKSMNISKVTIHSEPLAEDFYLAMGASRIGEIESTVFEGRKLPLLEFEVSN
ncbi:GNAT family N-acetyltransferase [Paenibacillus sp. GSMTC-2017]|uniref:GNAT family N-acetyltransferase n=1 Tax=Paenibacillus sp. GSMTC-2017 TaxID=2794350 RepID=UPI0018D640C1|nr:GNAT family N-acetyltransferase [Paenibacillus sp. GSMTC-2017]MBH5317508.1 GNAT family N-acetyltransferase [Paenibacillus sp. GSMTC-2017]